MLEASGLPPAWKSEVARDASGQLLSFMGYIDSLLADGWKRIGFGYFAEVFERDEVVIKVCRRDPAYVNYMKHVLSSPANRAHPQIVDVVELEGAGEKFHRIVLERLDAFDAHRKRGEVTLDEIRELAYRISVAEAAEKGSSEIRPDDERVLAAMTPDERLALEGIIAIAHEHGYLADLETKNMMLRNGEEIVFIDPLSVRLSETELAAHMLRLEHDSLTTSGFIEAA